MLRIETAPEHVAHAIGLHEDCDHQLAIFLPEGVEQHRLVLAQGRCHHFEEGFITDPLLVEGPGLLGHPDGVIKADSPCKLGSVVRGRRDRHRRGARIELDRRDVELQLREGLDQIESHQPAHAHDPREGELRRQPVAPARGGKLYLVLAERDPRPIAADLLDRERDREGDRFLVEGMLWPLQRRIDPASGGLYRHDPAAGALCLGALGGVEGKGALGAQQIGHAHAGEHRSDRIGRIGDRYTQHG